MAAKSELQFAGEFLVEECKIVSTTGEIYDIMEIVEEINVFEPFNNNIESPDSLTLKSISANFSQSSSEETPCTSEPITIKSFFSDFLLGLSFFILFRNNVFLLGPA